MTASTKALKAVDRSNRLVQRLEMAAGLLEEFDWEGWPNLDYPAALMNEAADALRQMRELAVSSGGILQAPQSRESDIRNGWSHYVECLDGCGRLPYGGDIEWSAWVARRHMESFEDHRANIREN